MLKDKTGKLKVSVVITVFNHDKFVAKAIEGVLGQETNFDIEIIIAEDASNDNSSQIIDQFASQHPEKIIRSSSERNVGLWVNALKAWGMCRGTYMSILDGDDWWTCSQKLQKQVDFLDKNPSYTGCFHDAEILTPESTSNTASSYYQPYKSYSQIYNYQSELHPWDLIERTIIPTGSFVFRNLRVQEKLVEYQEISESLDWLVQLMVIKGSKFKYFNETWSVYNNNRGGMTKMVPTSKFIKNNIAILKKLRQDEYYRNLKHHIYFMLAKESTNMLFLNHRNFRTYHRLGWVLKNFLYMQKHIYHRTKSLLSQL